MSKFRPRLIVALPLALLLIVSLITINPAPESEADSTSEQAISVALDWLRTKQAESGGFIGMSGEADPSTTADAVLAFAAAGVNPLNVTSTSGTNPIDYLLSQADAVAGDPGAAAKLVLALHTVPIEAERDVDPRSANGVNLIQVIEESFDPTSGYYGQGVYVQSLAILALTAADADVEPAAVDALINAQLDDGSWNFSGDPTSGTGDSNSTAMAIQALAAAGADRAAIDAGIGYLKGLQADDGSFAYDHSADPMVGDANSTALAIQALIATGVDPTMLPNGDALAALATFQNPSGAFYWMTGTEDDNTYSTIQAIPALAREPFPIAPVATDLQPTPSPAFAGAAAPVNPIEDCLYMEVTGHNVCGPFAEYWTANDGLKIFGYPLTESFMLDGIEVQYFERARMEHRPGAWPENGDILLGRLGAGQLDQLLEQ